MAKVKKAKKVSTWKKMHLIDRCLLIFMLLLISQSVYNLFAHEIAYEDASSLDSALRTTTSGIFGYFISGGSMAAQKTKKEEEESATTIPIGFQSTSTSSPTMTAAKEAPSTVDAPAVTSPAVSSPTITQTESTPWGQQVVIVTLIGLISLLILLVARNFATLNTTTIATLSQFRDFTSGSVGFLIGRANGNQS